MKIPIYILFACSVAWAQSVGGAPQTAVKAAPVTATSTPSTASSDTQNLADLVQQTRAAAVKSDADVSRLHIDKWKLDAPGKQQAQAYSESIRRNLTYSMPDLLQRIQASPASLNANFRLYRTLNALCDTLSSLVESAGAGTREQYEPLAADLAQLDRIRRQLADRIDLLAGANDAELARLRSQLATASTGKKPTASKVVVNDGADQPKAKKKPKPAQPPQPQTQPQPAK
jgi:hypothetical protein